jgi:hypothetical protein
MQELILKIHSQIVESNLDAFAASVKAEIAKIKTDLTTDEDFAAAERQVKELKEAETAIKAAKEAALADAEDVRKLLATADEIAALLAETRLTLDKQVKAAKERVKGDITGRCREALLAQINKADERIAATLRLVCTPAEINADIDAAAKGKKTASGIETACATVLQTWTDKIAEQEKKLVARYEKIPADKLHLFSDIGTVLTAGDIDALIAERLAADEARQAAEKARIEAAARAEAEARARAEAREQTETAPQTTPQDEGEQGDYRIIIRASLARAKEIAGHIKERYPQQFVALKKGEGK